MLGDILLHGSSVFRLPEVMRAILMVARPPSREPWPQLLGIVGQDLRPGHAGRAFGGSFHQRAGWAGPARSGTRHRAGRSLHHPYLLLSGLAELVGSHTHAGGCGKTGSPTIQVIALAWALVILVSGFGWRAVRPFPGTAAAAGEPSRGTCPNRPSGSSDPRGRGPSWAACLAGALGLTSSGSVTTAMPLRRSVVAFLRPISCFHASTETPGSVALAELRARSCC